MVFLIYYGKDKHEKNHRKSQRGTGARICDTSVEGLFAGMANYDTESFLSP